MKKIIYLITCISLCSFFVAAELEHLGGAFGAGLHGEFDEEGPEIQPISILSKDGWTYKVLRFKSDDSLLRIVRNRDNEPERVEGLVTFNRHWWLFYSSRNQYARLVDVSQGGSEIAMLVAGQVGYKYLKVTKSGNFSVPSGFHALSTVGINAENWKLTKLLINSTGFAHDFSAWDHSSSIDAIRLVNLNTIEVVAKNNHVSELCSIHDNHISKGKELIQHTSFANPSMASEVQISGWLSVESAPTHEDVKKKAGVHSGWQAIHAWNFGCIPGSGCC